MNSDTLTTFVGVAIGILHQVGVVGALPSTRSEWMSTGVSFGLGILGYYANKQVGVGKKV